VSPEHRFIQKSYDPRNDGRVGDVEDVPFETKGVEGEEVGNRAINDAVDGVADGATDNETDASGGKRRGYSGEPDDKRHRRGKSEEDEGPAAELASLLQEPVAHPLVPDEDEVEKGGKPNGPLGADIIEIEHPDLVGLVREQSERGDPKAERRQRTPEIPHELPLLRGKWLAAIELPDSLGVARGQLRKFWVGADLF